MKKEDLPAMTDERNCSSELTNEEIKERIDAYPRLIEAMDQIMNQCIGYMCMSVEMDANSIGQSIFYATGMNAEELHEESKRLMQKEVNKNHE